MHFSKPQFFPKVQVRLFFGIALVLAGLLSSCSEGEADEILLDLESINWKILPDDLLTAPYFTVDSIPYDSISIYKVCSSIHFDSTVVLTGFVIHYWEHPNEVNKIREIVVDTIDFAKQAAYAHKVRITKLKPNTDYQVRAMFTYLVGKDTTTISALPAAFKTE